MYSLMCVRPSQLSGSGRETLPNVRELWAALPDVREASRMCGNGWEALPEVLEASQMSESSLETLPDVPEGWESLPNVRKLSGGPLGFLGAVGRPS